MKSKELMIDDYVYESGCSIKPFKVAYIDSGVVCLDNNGDALMCLAENVSPIPLTDKILLCNGFIKIEKSDYIIYENSDKNVFIKEFPEFVEYSVMIDAHKDGCFVIENNNVMYVHQLQNLLNLSGIEIEFKL